MKFTKFEDIIAWQKGRELTFTIYKCLYFCSDYGYRNQIQRATVSIMNNIAEGFERRSNKELKSFLFIAKGSAGEVRSMLYIGKELKYFSEENFKFMHILAEEISRLLSGFIKTL